MGQIVAKYEAGNVEGNMKRKILEIGGYPPPRTGWAMRIYFLKREMDRMGIDCKILHVGKNRKVPNPNYINTYNGLDMVAKMFWYSLKRYRVHSHVNGDSPKGFVITFLGLFLNWILGNKPILTFHAGPVQLYFPKFRAPYLTPYYKLIFALSHKIICNNEPVKQNIMSYGVPAEKIHTIPAFSVQYLEFEEKPLPPEIDQIFSQHHPVIATYVYFRPEFFNEFMIDAMAELIKIYPDAQLIVMGGETGYEPIQQRAIDKGIGEHVHFVGDQDHDHFLTILRKSVFYLRTPVKDGVSTSVLEALYWGVPVVAAENGTRPEGVITYENKNIPDMVEKMKYVIEHAEEVRKNLVRPHVDDTLSKEIKLLTES